MINYFFVFLGVFITFYIGNSVKKKKLSIKESFWWIIACLIMLVLAVFPRILDWFAKILNVAYPPSLLFVVSIMFLIFINFRDSKRISELQTKVIDLGQELSILKEKVKNVKK